MTQSFSPSAAIRKFIWDQGFAIGCIQIEALIQDFISQMDAGKQKQSSLAMLPSFLKTPETIDCNRSVIVMDAGGSNLRCALASLKNKSGVFALELTHETFLAMPGSTESISKEKFFNALYQSIEHLIELSDTIGLCFSYPCEISESLDGKLLRWTKEVNASGVEGLWIAKELNQIIEKRHGEKKRIVLLNDTVATLLAGTLSQPTFSNNNHFIGFILGTGTNCAFSESPNRNIINIESGAYDGTSETKADKLLDAHCMDQGHYLFEKKISGRYLGELCLTLLVLAAQDKIFTPDFCNKVIDFSNTENHSLETEKLNLLLENQFTPLLAEQADFHLLHFILESVIDRAALLSAIHLCAVSQYQIHDQQDTNASNQCVICVEGSTFYQLKDYQRKITYFLENIGYKHRIQYQFVKIEHASLAGAALAALQAIRS